MLSRFLDQFFSKSGFLDNTNLPQGHRCPLIPISRVLSTTGDPARSVAGEKSGFEWNPVGESVLKHLPMEI